MASYTVPEENLAQLEARIVKLAKRAAKLGVTPPAVIRGARTEKKIKSDRFALGYYFQAYYAVELTGLDVVKLNGWTLAAVIDAQYHEDGTLAGNILRIVPGGPQVDVKYRTVVSFCDHCKTMRRRAKTMLVVSDAGEWKQVGTDCIKDFLGHQSAEAYAAWAEMMADAADFAEDSEREGFGGGIGIAPRFGLDEVLPIAAAAIRLYGWRSRKVADEFGGAPTSGFVSDWIMGTSKMRDEFEHKLVPNDADNSLAGNVIAWLSGLATRQNLNDYMYNLSVLGETTIVTPRNFGIICAAIATYAKEQEFEINRRKRFEDDAKSVYVGTVSKRELFSNLTISFIRQFERESYNYAVPAVTFLYKFRDEAGNILTWFASTDQGFEQGQTVSLVATVKNQEEYKGVKQTVITRAKVPVVKVPLTKEQKAAKAAAKLARNIEFRVQEANRRRNAKDDIYSAYDACAIMREIVNTLEDVERMAQ